MMKHVNNENVVQSKTGHEIITLNNVTHQNQKTNILAQVEIEDDQTNKFQTINRFAVLEMEQCDANEGNHMMGKGGTYALNNIANMEPNGKVIVAADVTNTITTPTVQTHRLSKVTKPLNPNATAFKLIDKENLNQSQSQQESTAQWANKVFGSKLVTTNQSCQDIPSQSMDTYGISEQVNEKDRLALTSGKLWEDQAEEDSEEG